MKNINSEEKTNEKIKEKESESIRVNPPIYYYVRKL